MFPLFQNLSETKSHIILHRNIFIKILETKFRYITSTIINTECKLYSTIIILSGIMLVQTIHGTEMRSKFWKRGNIIIITYEWYYILEKP